MAKTLVAPAQRMSAPPDEARFLKRLRRQQTPVPTEVSGVLLIKGSYSLELAGG